MLYEFEVSTWNDAGEPTPLALSNARADFSQQNWNVTGLIDGDPDTGWGINPQFGQPHWAAFQTSEPIANDDALRIQFRLPQHYGGGRVIGRLRLSAMTGDPRADELSEAILAALQKSPDERTAPELKTLRDFQAVQDAELQQLNTQLVDVRRSLNALEPPTTLVMVEMDEARMSSIFHRGNFLEPGADVVARTPAVLHPLDSHDPQTLNRLDLANWIVSRDNPLTARVVVNRWWGELFGQGLVTTPEDFGSQGERPSHPELLDWLAVEFMENGWSMKHIHRLIVLSATYQQDARITEAAILRDPDNRLLARGPRWRMPAEMIRDNALAISGLLSTREGGPPVYPPQPAGIWRHVGRNAPNYDTDTDEDRFRRGIYVVWRRSAPYPSFVNFDAPDRGACVVQRSRTNTPLQALTLLNDPAYVEMAFGLSLRLMEHAGTDADRIAYAFRLCVSREPSSHESEHLLSVLERERTLLEADEAAAGALIPEQYRSADVPLSIQGAWFTISNILLNLDETITRG